MFYKLALSLCLVAALFLVSALEAAAGQTKFAITGVISDVQDGFDIFEGEFQVGMPFTGEAAWNNLIPDNNEDPARGDYNASPSNGQIEITMNFGSAEIVTDSYAASRVAVVFNDPFDRGFAVFAVVSDHVLDNWPEGLGELQSIAMELFMDIEDLTVFGNDDSLPTAFNLSIWRKKEFQLLVARSGHQAYIAGEIQTMTPVAPPVTDCSDGLDNDGDGFTDFPDDPHCNELEDLSEAPDCSDGLDNDGDGFIDFPDDPGCIAAWGLREDPACDDGFRNDGDALTDFPADPGCFASWWPLEDPECDDGVENDSDGKIDFPADPGCRGSWSDTESPQCDDGINNDPADDSLTDLNDPDCPTRWDTSEACGLGFELMLALPPLIWLRGRRRRTPG